MADRRTLNASRHAALLLASALMLGGPASGQGPFPPIPGPFPVIPGGGVGAQMPMPTPPAAPEMPAALERPVNQPPANAMRLPYWMQAPVATVPEGANPAAPAEAAVTAPVAAQPAPAPARTGVPQPPVPTGFVQPMPSWAGPGFGAPGYGAQAPWPGQPAPGMAPGMAPGAAPGFMVPQAPVAGGAMPAPGAAWPQQPAWGYGPAPGWAPAPFAPAPGWGAPAPGAGQ